MPTDDAEPPLSDSADQPTRSAAVPTPLPELPGKDFGTRYRILKRLGQGGMGVVYHAYDKELQREVALKIIKPSIAENPIVIERFRREILLASRVTHKNVLRIHDLGEIDGVKFISMQYINGNDLAKIISREGRLQPQRAAAILKQLCHGLKAAHDEGVLHRDLKPQNVMIDEKDHVYITDFGLARTFESEGDPSLTGFGEAMGTPMYMSPEQLKGEKPDRRADIYSLGLLTYQMLTGALPFPASPGFGWVVERMKSGPKNPKEMVSDLPDYLSDIVRKCTENNPDLRYQDESEILADVEQHHVAWSSKNFIARRKSWKYPAIAVLLTVVLAAAAWFYFRKQPSQSVTFLQPSAGIVIFSLENGTGDPKMDWVGLATAEAIQSQLRDTGALLVVSNERLHDVLNHAQSSGIGGIVQHVNANFAITGKISNHGNQFSADTTLRDLHENQAIPLHINGDHPLPELVSRITNRVAEYLGVPLKSANDQQKFLQIFLGRSPGTLSSFYAALKKHYDNQDDQAIAAMESVLKQDATFPLAHAWLARMYFAADDEENAKAHLVAALKFPDSLPRFDRVHLLAIQSLIENDEPKIIAAYKEFQTEFPKSVEAYSEVAAYFYDQEKWVYAVQNYQRAYELDPRSVYILTELGRSELKNANAQTSLKYLTDAQTLSKEFRTDAERADLLNVLGYAYMQLDYNSTALEHFQKSIDIKKRIGDQKGMATTLSNMGLVYSSMNRYEDAQQSYQQALAIARSLNDKKTTGRTLNNLGYLAEKYARLDEALDYYQQGLAVARSLGSHSEIANRLNNIGFIYSLSGRYSDAATYFDLGLQEIKDTDRMLRAFILLSSGDLLVEEAKYSRALKFFEEGLKIWRDTQYDVGLAFVLIDIAHTYDLLGDSKQSEKYFNEAEKVVNSIQDPEALSYFYIHRSQTLRRLGRLADAESMVIKASSLAVETHNKTPALIAIIETGAVYNDSGRPDRALPLLQQTLKETEKLGLKPLSISARIELARSHQLLKHYAEALRELATTIPQAAQINLNEQLFRVYSLQAEIFKTQGKNAMAQKQHELALSTVDEIRRDLDKDHAALFMNRKDVREFLSIADYSFRSTN